VAEEIFLVMTDTSPFFSVAVLVTCQVLRSVCSGGGPRISRSEGFEISGGADPPHCRGGDRFCPSFSFIGREDLCGGVTLDSS